MRLSMHSLRPFTPALRPFALALRLFELALRPFEPALRLLAGGLRLAEAARTAHEHKQRLLTQDTAGQGMQR